MVFIIQVGYNMLKQFRQIFEICDPHFILAMSNSIKHYLKFEELGSGLEKLHKQLIYSAELILPAKGSSCLYHYKIF